VEGAHVSTCCHDETKHGVHVLEHVACRNAHNAESITFQNRVTGMIALRLITDTVPFTVDLDDQPPLKAGEVDCDLPDGKLPTKLQASGALSQNLPEQHFRQAHLAPQLTCALYLLDRCLEDAWAPSTMLRMVPLPVPGRI